MEALDVSKMCPFKFMFIKKKVTINDKLEEVEYIIKITEFIGIKGKNNLMVVLHLLKRMNEQINGYTLCK